MALAGPAGRPHGTARTRSRPGSSSRIARGSARSASPCPACHRGTAPGSHILFRPRRSQAARDDNFSWVSTPGLRFFPARTAGWQRRSAPVDASLGHCRSRRLDLGLHGIEVEARALLHRRKLDRGLGQLQDLLLDEHKAPELVLEPLEVRLGPELGTAVGPTRTLERIEPQVGDVGHIGLGLVTEPATGLIDEPELVVADAHRTQLALSEVPDLFAVRRSLAGDHVRLVVAVQMHPAGVPPSCLPFFSSSVMLELPAAATRVGNQSSPEMMPFSTLPT